MTTKTVTMTTTITGRTNMLDDFLIRAALAGLAVAMAAGPLGCFVVWRRMAYFGEATSHAAILGVALSLAFQADIFVGTLAVALVMALTVSTLSERGMAMDTALGVLAHAALAFGLVGVSFLQGVRVDLTAYLFGDILTVTRTDLVFIWLGVLVVCGLLYWRWTGLITATLNEELAVSSGINPALERRILVIALAVVVAVAIKVVGALLIVAMLIIPAAAARGLSRTPEAMAIASVVVGGLAVGAGLWASFRFDTPAGPSIIAAASVLFAITNLLAVRRG